MIIPKYYSETELKKQINNQSIQLWINSYGGSGSNWLEQNLKSNYKISTYIWRLKLCHYIRPINNIPITMAVYIYANPVYAIVSELRRKYLRMNFYKMMPIEYKELRYSIRTMLEKMSEQMNNWKNANVNYPVILIKYEKINDYIVDLEKFFDTKFEIEFRQRKTDEEKINWYSKKFNFKRIQSTLQKTIREYENMPDFQIIQPKDNAKKID